MIAPRYSAFLGVGLLLGVNWLTIAFLNPNSSNGYLETVAIGYFIGSLFAHATLAAAWTAFGPGPLMFRLPLSLLWILLLAIAIAINIALHHGGMQEVPVVLGTIYFGQWLVLQLPLWGLRAGFQLQLRHAEDGISSDPRQWQFGIRQLMIVTAIVGVIFGIGRLLIIQLPRHFSIEGEPLVFAFLGVCAVVFTLPLMLAAVLNRGSILGVPIVLALIAVGTYFEEPLMRSIAKSGPEPNAYDLMATNFFTCAFILMVAVIVRCGGYSLKRISGDTAKLV